MQTTDTSDSIFFIDRRDDDIRLVFTTVDTLATPGPKEPLWWLTLPNEDHLSAMTAWVGERQDSWPEWRSIHDESGAQALREHIADLWGEGVESCHSVMVQRSDEDDRVIEISAMLVYRKAPILRHAFQSAPHRDAFYRWLNDREICQKSNALFDVGCLQGRAVLAEGLDRIAARELDAKPRRRTRRKEA